MTTRPFDLDIRDYKETIRMMEESLTRMNEQLRVANQANAQLLLRIDQLKWENEKLKNEVEMLSIDLGVK